MKAKESSAECEPMLYLCRCEDDGNPMVLRREEEQVEMATLAMEDMLESYLTTKHPLPVDYPKRYDVSLLHCRQNRPFQILEDEECDMDSGDNKEKRLVPFFSILGILEDHHKSKGSVIALQDMTIQATSLWCPNLRISMFKTNHGTKCTGPPPAPPAHSTWERSPMQQNDTPHDDNDKNNLEARVLDMTWIDLRSYQRDYTEFFLPTLASMTFFLRSLLGTSHTASPWCPNDDPNKKNTVNNSIHDSNVVALLLSDVSERFVQFRVGDVCPSWYLYSTARLQVPAPDSQEFPWMDHHPNNQDTEPAVLLIYRRMPPRDLISSQSPSITWQQRFASKFDHLEASAMEETPLIPGCLWETYFAFKETEDKKPDNKQRYPLFRMIAPPYLNYGQDFSMVALDGLLESIDVLRKEALRIDQHWTPWPEKQHYKAVSEGAAPDAKPWTVFPLCYCFPANAPENLQWIPTTCALVPKTQELLSRHIGRNLRTALFSRLDPETQLQAHTGWADLANHVVRLHLPLIVPPGGLCGTWVDGCVQTHQEGQPLVFDDSKVHRAFNYSPQERIVLILDLARPSNLPLGTATGGHTDELDQFIAQMSQVS